MKYIFYLILLIGNVTFGQKQQKIDSLQEVLLQVKEGNKKAAVLLELSIITQNKNIDESEKYTFKALRLSQIDPEMLSEIYFQIAYLNYKEQKDNKAILYFNKLDSVLKPTNTINESFIKSKLYRAQIAKFTFTIEGLKRGKEYLKEMLLISKKNKQL